jgi:hypothetical protein
VLGDQKPQAEAVAVSVGRLRRAQETPRTDDWPANPSRWSILYETNPRVEPNAGRLRGRFA